MTELKNENNDIQDEKIYEINRYFDDIFEAVIATNLTLEEARTSIKRFKNGYYVSYRIEKNKRKIKELEEELAKLKQ